MTKIILIAGLILFLLYYISKKLSASFTASNSPAIIVKNGYQKIDTSKVIIADTSQKVMKNVGIGAILLIIMLALIIKVKLLLFLLPISIYMMGYLFLFKNHLKKTTSQVIWYNKQTADVMIESLTEKTYRFNLLSDVQAVQQIESIQNTKGLLFGYFRIKTKEEIIEIPYLVYQNNPSNQDFFSSLKSNYKIDLQKKIFPII
ncbi:MULTISPECIES: hypothetical protein [Sphingobacterium]|jgi:hypothetical protein|uniref:hypothetical protein n=1 Tax=Sphingobacterium TaxID=28453 RepID=UPI0004E600FD|nr:MULTISPECIES: hypothetical protein [Sphingobacterium]UPZ36125.1 hypothetical protein MUB18_18665 [Sphingobacterium sp. PCS056]UXD71660.1 hypothetical protein MUK51_10275 [Sphingobacterium faecium]WGQ15318.1 hypothetical protein QG727_02660 [Sphingobacterium faecium]CDS92197.1 conserved membrane hypothetical protein [Sphingobacterium sp. PM2-P1-29]